MQYRSRTTIAARYARTAAALLALLLLLTFACGIVVNTLGRCAAQTVLVIGIAALAIDALILALSILAPAFIALRPARTSSHGGW